MDKPRVLASLTLGTAMALSGCGEEHRGAKTTKVHKDHPAAEVHAKEKHHREHRGPTDKEIADILGAQRAEYEKILSIGMGMDPRRAFGEKEYADATRGGYTFITCCSDERNVPKDRVKIGLAGTIASPGVVDELKKGGNVAEVGWHAGCAANGNDDELSQARARDLASKLGAKVVSFGNGKEYDYQMKLVPGHDHLHPAAGLGINGDPYAFNPGVVHKDFSRFDVTWVGQTPEELRSQVKLLVGVAMKNIDAKKRAEAGMPLLVYAAGSERSRRTYQEIFDVIEPIKGPIEEAYGKDAVRYVGFNVDAKR
jgi:hypothetical protein